MNKKNISEFTESEFLDFVKGIYFDTYPTEESHIEAVLAFEKIIEHPSGSDLLYYPEKGKEGPDNVVKEVKAWRVKNKKSLFKS